MTEPRQYPYQDGDVTVLGPEVFASADGQTISWKGVNYVLQPATTTDGPPSPAPSMQGPALTYVSARHEGMQTILRVDLNSPSDLRERALCRALLHHALTLLDASEPARTVALHGEARRM